MVALSCASNDGCDGDPVVGREWPGEGEEGFDDLGLDRGLPDEELCSAMVCGMKLR